LIIIAGEEDKILKKACVSILSLLALIATASALSAQNTASPELNPGAPTLQAAPNVKVLEGRWVRPDGGYTISIKGADADGNLDATYFNPATLPFSKARATFDANTLNVFLELQSGGYAGSTYALKYDPVGDRLAGVYFQAVAQKNFDVYFVRAK
jgi:hypothetical protein